MPPCPSRCRGSPMDRLNLVVRSGPSGCASPSRRTSRLQDVRHATPLAFAALVSKIHQLCVGPRRDSCERLRRCRIRFNLASAGELDLMEAESSWLHVLKDTLLQAAMGLVRLIPYILGAVMVIVAGWLLAKLLRTLAVRGLHALTRTVTSLRRNATAHRPLMEARSVPAIGAYMPALLAGLLILRAGCVFSLLAKDLVTAAASSAHVAYADVLGRSVQILIFSMAVVIGIDQVGINVTFLVVIVAIILGMIFGGMALAFGLGARQVVSNIVATHYVRQMYQIGDSVAIGTLQGRISHINSVSVVLEPAQGRCHVPTALFLSEPSSRLERPLDHDQRNGT